jgi:hypothetical protein
MAPISFEQPVLGLLEESHHLLARDRGEARKEVVDRLTRFEIVEQLRARACRRTQVCRP